MVNVNTNKVLANSFQKQSSNNRAVYSSRQCKKNFSIANLFADKLNLVVYEVCHVPVLLSFAGVKYERLNSSFNCLLVIAELCQLNLAFCFVVACSHYWEACLIYLWKDINLNPVNNIVRATVYDDTLNVR